MYRSGVWIRGVLLHASRVSLATQVAAGGRRRYCDYKKSGGANHPFEARPRSKAVLCALFCLLTTADTQPRRHEEQIKSETEGNGLGRPAAGCVQRKLSGFERRGNRAQDERRAAVQSMKPSRSERSEAEVCA